MQVRLQYVSTVQVRLQYVSTVQVRLHYVTTVQVRLHYVSRASTPTICLHRASTPTLYLHRASTPTLCLHRASKPTTFFRIYLHAALYLNRIDNRNCFLKAVLWNNSAEERKEHCGGNPYVWTTAQKTPGNVSTVSERSKLSWHLEKENRRCIIRRNTYVYCTRDFVSTQQRYVFVARCGELRCGRANQPDSHKVTFFCACVWQPRPHRWVSDRSGYFIVFSAALFLHKPNIHMH